MSARTPEEVQNLWGKHFNAGDIDNLMALFEADAMFMYQPGQTVTGHTEIREKLQGWISGGLKANLQFQLALKTGNLALLYSRWTMNGTGPDGKQISMSGQTSDVVRQQADGTWLFVIDNPLGGQGADPVP
jgi:ketosteroid isomerase-like protein